MRRNPYQVALFVAGSLMLLTAGVLYMGLSEVIDYETYDFAEVAALTAWIALMVGGSIVAFVGAAVIAGLAWARHSQAASALPVGQ